MTRGARRAVERAITAVMPKPDATRRRVILCYHSIHPAAPFRSATPGQFRDHLDWLEMKCTIVPLASLRTHPSTGRPLVALTFDDGLADNHRYAAPELVARRLAATFFPTVGFVERVPEVVRRMQDLWMSRDGVEPMHWEDMQDMRSAGLDFGSHTWSHKNLGRLPPTMVRDELRRSKQVLEERLQAPTVDLAYPFGKPGRHVNDASVSIARSEGYIRGAVVSPRAIADRDDDLHLPRIVVGGDLAGFSEKVLGAIDWHGHVRDRLRILR